MKKMTNALMFLIGASVGAAGAWYLLKSKYEKLAEDEIESVKEVYAAREKAIVGIDLASETPGSAEEHKIPEKPDLMTYARKLQKEGYTEYARTVVGEKPTPLPVSPETYVISPEEFGEMDGYTQISLTYFADGVLADESDEPLDNPEEIIGDALDHFGEYEDDSVFVRNDARRCDYEILKDNRKFEEARKNRPPAPPIPEKEESDEDDEEE